MGESVLGSAWAEATSAAWGGMPLEATLLHTSARGGLDSPHPALGLSFPSNSQDPS